MKILRIGIILFCTVLPTVAFANAGSPMMWFGIMHSLVLNAVIGLTESAILSKFKIPNRMWLVIIGNYVSMFIGLYFIAPSFSNVAGNDDFWGGQTSLGNYELGGFLAGMISSYVATLIIELPFFSLAVKDKTQRQKLLLPFFIANTITNAAMALIYYSIVSSGAHW